MASEGELIGKVAAVAADREGKYLTFSLAGEEFGVSSISAALMFNTSETESTTIPVMTLTSPR